MAAAAQPVPAQVVGDAFVEQYYGILYQSPELVHKFYKDISKIVRPEKDGTTSITSSMNAINNKILSLNDSDYRAEITSVDAEDSFEGGVHVLVTGYLTRKDGTIQHFAQTFFLAPQENGFFVLNDILRHVKSIAPPTQQEEPFFSCPVCMGPLVEETSTKCGHIFCKRCIRAATTSQDKCPTCRRKVLMNELIRVYLSPTS